MRTYTYFEMLNSLSMPYILTFNDRLIFCPVKDNTLTLTFWPLWTTSLTLVTLPSLLNCKTKQQKCKYTVGIVFQQFRFIFFISFHVCGCIMSVLGGKTLTVLKFKNFKFSLSLLSISFLPAICEQDLPIFFEVLLTERNTQTAWVCLPGHCKSTKDKRTNRHPPYIVCPDIDHIFITICLQWFCAWVDNCNQMFIQVKLTIIFIVI